MLSRNVETVIIRQRKFGLEFHENISELCSDIDNIYDGLYSFLDVNFNVLKLELSIEEINPVLDVLELKFGRLTLDDSGLDLVAQRLFFIILFKVFQLVRLHQVFTSSDYCLNWVAQFFLQGLSDHIFELFPRFYLLVKNTERDVFEKSCYEFLAVYRQNLVHDMNHKFLGSLRMQRYFISVVF